MASVALSRRVGKVVGYPPLVEMSDQQRREFHEALLEADTFEELSGKQTRQYVRGSPPWACTTRREPTGSAMTWRIARAAG